jgi:hypothetical protein
MAELHEVIAGICAVVRHLISSYEVIRDPGNLDYLIYQVSKLLRILVAVSYCSTQVLDAIGQGLTLLEEIESSSSLIVGGYVPQLASENRRGRPRLNITKEQIEYLLNLGFSCPKIADVIGVSLSTVRRRMTEHGLSVKALYSSISDQELDYIAGQIKHDFPNCGHRMMQGHLLRQGHRIQHARIRDCLHRIDAEGVAIRWATTVQRRKYTVSSPQSLRHIDGNHKLIRLV